MRWWDHGFRGEGVGRVLFDVIFGGDDMLSLGFGVASRRLAEVVVLFVFGDVMKAGA